MGIEVIGIIVNKLPSACFMCPFGARIDGGSVCAAKYNTRKQNNNHKYYVDPVGKPPSWCPLIAANDIVSYTEQDGTVIYRRKEMTL